MKYLQPTYSAISWLRRGALLLPAGALFFAACRADTDLNPGPAPAPPPPSSYLLTIPATLNAQPRVPADNPLTAEGVELGRFLFYDPVLSIDSTLSCGTCHQQDKAFTDGRAHALGVNNGAGLRSTMGLGNVMWHQHLNWDGRFTRIEDQNRLPIENPLEMGLPLPQAVARLQRSATYPARFARAFGSSVVTEELLLKALAQFERTLISGDSRYDRFLTSGAGLSNEEILGARLFATHPLPAINPANSLRGGNCGDCHGGGAGRGDLPGGLFRLTPETITSNGLDSNPMDGGLGAITGLPTDRGRFVAPTMRNIALTAPYMHDGRFATLEEVLDHYNEHVKFDAPNLDPQMGVGNELFGDPGLGLTPTEKKAIVAFLRTLTDSTFITNPRFAAPQP